ncbi:MAG: efflux RND transporter periplasmic adaptor subunit [Phycisphaerales bacterium]|nr:MAG: efflux RND transporter periplasmic adaptor subunit [Phycisphaerales bacterium]
MKTLLGYIIIIGVVAGLIYLNEFTRSEDGKSVLHVAAEEEIEVRVGAPQTRDIVCTVQAPGEVEPFNEVDISAEVVGKIIEMPVEEGDLVKAGDLLCRLDDADYKARITSAQANVDKLKAAIVQVEADRDKAQRDFERQKRLSETDATSALELADYQTALIRATAACNMRKQELIEAEAMLVAAQDDLTKTVIEAPIDGIVSQSFAEQGEVVITGTMNNPGTRIMVISDLSTMQVRSRVDESDAPLVKAGQTARIYLQSDTQTSIAGHVLRVATKGTKPVGRDVVTFETLVIVDASDPRVKPGMSANVDIEVRRSDGALTVPVEAVVNRKRRDLPEDLISEYEARTAATSEGVELRKAEYLKTVFSIEEGKAVAHLVETGISDDTNVEIVSGLPPGAQLVLGPYRSLDSLKIGSKIKITNEDELKKDKEGEVQTADGTADSGAEAPAENDPESESSAETAAQESAESGQEKMAGRTP